ncbi:hypothetical protein BHE74_00014322 [Ensete ventricosum]|nr:hypothetical protein BHE74_00014322 [Ensete ventricosum]RZR83451.1 hypothetical protein BHM03_00010055 [Ensete ventricosum]
MALCPTGSYLSWHVGYKRIWRCLKGVNWDVWGAWKRFGRGTNDGAGGGVIYIANWGRGLAWGMRRMMDLIILVKVWTCCVRLRNASSETVGRKGSLYPKAKDRVCHVGLLPEVFPRLVGCWHFYDIGPPSSAKNVNVFYVMVEVSAQLGSIRVHKAANVVLGRQSGIGG